ARVAAGVAGEQVVVKRGVRPAPGATEGVVIEVQRLAGDRPLDGDVLNWKLLVRPAAGLLLHVSIERQVLVQSPTRGYVVYDDVPDWVAPEGIVAFLEVAATESHVADDDVVRVDFGRLPADAYAIPRRGLTRDGDERAINCKRGL